MKKTLTWVFILTVISLFFIGCAKETPVAGEDIIEDTTESDIGAGIDEIAEMEEDLDASDLDDIEKDLEEIDW